MTSYVGPEAPISRTRPLSRRAVAAGLGFVVAGAAPARAAPRVGFADIIGEDGDFTSKARSVAGQQIEIRGYMAPPLKPEINFFVLTKLPAAVCPFCDSAAAWPNDIVLVQMARPIHAINYDLLIRVTGTLELGVDTDEATGFVSKVRVRDAVYAKA
jgi:hypothetical protein